MSPGKAKVGMRVVDRWYNPYNDLQRHKSMGVGTIVRILKTRVRIRFPKLEIKELSYDLAHFREYIITEYEAKKRKIV